MTPLPIDSYLPEITDALRQHRAIVLVAEPGAGKTTRVPPAILRAGLLSADHPNLVMLQPRRIAARAAAERIAEEQNWPVGGEVGYQVRFENRITPRTRLRVVTEAILTRQLLDDPSLDGVGCVVLDEFHERSIHSDLALALLREARDSLRDDLLIVVMSATLDADHVARFLTLPVPLGEPLRPTPIVRVPGRTFPVDVEYRPAGGADLEQAVARAVRDNWDRAGSGDGINDGGHVLVFLPGAFEIERCQQALSGFAAERGAVVRPLHGSLPFEQQRAAVAPSSNRKIVLATNIAETSLTIDGVRCVIDSGLARQPRFDPQRGLDALTLGRISAASATQRAGRAGRTSAGRCVRLWTALEQQQLEPFDRPDVASIDLAPAALDLHAWGENDLDRFRWFERPPSDALAAAERLLAALGAIDDGGVITPLGKRMAAMPVHPRLARLLIAAADAGQARMGATVAALLSEKDFVRREWQDRHAIGSASVMASSDVLVRLHLMEAAEQSRFRRGAAGDQVDVFQAQQVARVRDQLLRTVSNVRADDARDADELLHQLVLLAYPDRVCRRRAGDPKAAVMVGGVGVRLDAASAVHNGEYFVAVDPRQDDRARPGFVGRREAVVRIASRIEPEWLATFFPQSVHKFRTPRYDEDRQRVVAVVETRYLDLTLRQETETNVPRDEAGRLLAAALADELPVFLEQDERLAPFIHRLRFAMRHAPKHDWPALDVTLLEEAAQNKQSRDQVRAGLFDAIRHRLVYPLDRLLEDLAPESLTVPTGSQIKLTYPADPAQPPVLAVRLQEVFGLVETPRVAAGRVPVLLHLLGPNYRPVQITQDLASFWKNTYLQVRKDSRADYPRHSWPDDPTTAPAVRGARRRTP